MIARMVPEKSYQWPWTYAEWFNDDGEPVSVCVYPANNWKIDALPREPAHANVLDAPWRWHWMSGVGPVLGLRAAQNWIRAQQ